MMYRFTYRDYDRVGNWARVETRSHHATYVVLLGRTPVGVIDEVSGRYMIYIYSHVEGVHIYDDYYPTIEQAADAIVSSCPAPRGPGGAAGPRNALDAQRFRKLTPLRRYNAIGVARRLKRCGLSSADAWSDGIMVARAMELPGGESVDHRHDRCETCALRTESVVNRGMYGMAVLLVCDGCWDVQERALSEATRDVSANHLYARQLDEERARVASDRAREARQSSWHLEGRYAHWTPVGSQDNWVAVEHAAAELTRELQDTGTDQELSTWRRALRLAAGLGDG